MNAKNKQCIGIDLGTSFSLISIYRDNEASVIPNALGSYLTPSVVGIDDNGSILVGTSAQERLITHPEMTAAQFKRVMGTNKEITLANKQFRPEELSAFVLKVLKNDAEIYLGDHVSEAIISVPAYFNDAQRKATKAAAQLAGLDVERLINEPTAAAIAYGLPRLNKDMTFVVLDLGGGTFDVTVLEIFENTIEVHASAGDTFLGGNDFTTIIADHMKTVIGMTDSDLSMYEKNILWKKAEEVKKALSEKEHISTELYIQKKRFPWELSRHEFDTFTRPLIDRMRPPVERALSDAHVNPSDLSAIVLVGGATRMPIVRDLVSRMFGREPYTDIDPDKVIAMGAAIQSAFKSRSGDLKEVVMTDVCPYTLGVEVVRQAAYNDYIPGHFLPIIERNSTIPISRVETLQTVRDNQTTIEINIFQGESRLVQNNSFLGKLALTVPKDKAGNQNIDVRFTYDINGLLEVEAFAHGTGETKKIIIEENPGVLSKKEIEERLKKIQHLKIHPREQTQNRAVIARGERLYQELLGEERKAVADILAFLDAAIASQDTKTIENARNKAISLLDEIESGRSLF